LRAAPRAAAGPAHRRRAAVLDRVPDPHLCLDHILQREGLLNHVLLALRIVDEPIRGSRPTPRSISASSIPICRSWCCRSTPSLEKMDESLLEAAADLGCPRWKAFWLVTLPLVAAGVFAGALLCFIPIVGEFVIPDLLGGLAHA
jgi:putrescine transport system permease protein